MIAIDILVNKYYLCCPFLLGLTLLITRIIKEMKKSIYILISIAFLANISFAQIPSGYYDDAAGLSGEQLKTALYHIIKGHDSQSYNSLWTHFQTTDKKPNGKVWDMYSDVPGGTPPYEYTFGSDQCGNYGGEGDCYNREHSFPKSWFNEGSPMNTDLFHLVPTDGYVNGMRGNYPFGEVSSAQWTSLNGSKRGSNSTSGYSGIVFEPIDAYKGDFARAYFYMATRYENVIHNWDNNNENADAVLDGTTYPVFEDWYLDLMIAWHNADPVSQKEIDRNNDIYDIQDNRNPFVDHAEWVATVWGGSDLPPVISNVNYSPTNPDENEAVSVSATITDDVNINSATLYYGFSSSAMNNTVNMSASGNQYSAQIPGQSAGQAVYFKVSATDSQSNTTNSSTYNYQVNDDAGTIALPFLEDFNDQTLGIFYDYSVAGNNEFWENANSGGEYFAEMSAFNGSSNPANEDWIITPAINFNAYSDEVLSFSSAMKDFSDNNTFVSLLYSTNYSGSGNPNAASWTDISSQANWSAGDYNWVESGDISLAGISGNQVYIAIKYESQAGSAKTWQIDDFEILINQSSNEAPIISNVQYSPTNPEQADDVNVSAQITDDVSVESAIIAWGFSSSNLANIVNMTGSGDNYSGMIPSQNAGSTIYFRVRAFDDESEMSESSIYQYTVESGITSLDLPFLENFESDDLGVFNSVDVEGNGEEWETDNAGSNIFAFMSNYSGSSYNENEDWMITPAINFDLYNDEILSFESSRNSSSDPNTHLYLKISTDYNGVGDPNSATWTNLSSDAQWSSGSNQWVNSGEIDLSGISGSSVYLAFQYTAQNGSGNTWKLDDISVTIDNVSNFPPVISNINHSPYYPTNEDEVVVSALITDDDEISSAFLYYGYSATQVNEEIEMEAAGNNFSASIPPQAAFQTIYYKILAVDSESETTWSPIRSYDVDYIESTSNIEKQSIKLYPNPAKSFVVLENDNPSILMDVKVYHISGRLLMEKQMKSRDQLNTSQLMSSFYFVKIDDGIRIINIPLVICK